MTTWQRPLDNFFDDVRTKCAILMKFCTSKQNLVTNILKINLSPPVTSMCVQTAHDLGKSEFTD